MRRRHTGVAVLAALVVGGATALMAGTPAQGSPATLYVATSGADSGNCQNAAAPCATLAYAFGQAATGDTIDVGPGTFTADDLGPAQGATLTVQGALSPTAPATVVQAPSSQGAFATNRSMLVLNDLTIEGNGGIAVQNDYAGYVHVYDSTITGSGTGVCGCGPSAGVDVFDSTITGTTLGVSVQNSGGVQLIADTVTGNTTGENGGPFGPDVAGTIFAGNTKDCAAALPSGADLGYNLDDDGSCGLTAADHDLSDTPPDLGPLQNNGGPTLTEVPALASPVLNRIPTGTTAEGTTLCPGTDQRGVARPQGALCDIGATELQLSNIRAITSPTAAPATKGQPFAFTVTTTGTPTPVITEHGTLPKGLTFSDHHNGSATIAGTPKKVQTVHVTIKAVFGTGNTKYIASEILTIAVAA